MISTSASSYGSDQNLYLKYCLKQLLLDATPHEDWVRVSPGYPSPNQTQRPDLGLGLAWNNLVWLRWWFLNCKTFKAWQVYKLGKTRERFAPVFAELAGVVAPVGVAPGAVAPARGVLADWAEVQHSASEPSAAAAASTEKQQFYQLDRSKFDQMFLLQQRQEQFLSSSCQPVNFYFKILNF